MSSMVESVMKKTGLERLSGNVSKIFKGWNQEIADLTGRDHDAQHAQQFKQWITDATSTDRKELSGDVNKDLKALTTWLAGLSEEDMQAYCHKVAHFCEVLHFKLEWLVDPYLEKDPNLKKTLEDTVLLFCVSDWKASQSAEHIKAFASFREWLNDPESDQNQALTQKLFALLIKEDKLDETPSALLLLSEDERRKYIVQTIKKVAEADMPFIISYLARGEVLSDTATAKPAPTKATTSSSSKKPAQKQTEEN